MSFDDAKVQRICWIPIIKGQNRVRTQQLIDSHQIIPKICYFC